MRPLSDSEVQRARAALTAATALLAIPSAATLTVQSWDGAGWAATPGIEAVPVALEHVANQRRSDGVTVMAHVQSADLPQPHGITTAMRALLTQGGATTVCRILRIDPLDALQSIWQLSLTDQPAPTFG